MPNDPIQPASVNDIMHEVARATEKFPTWPTDPLHAVAVLGEEYGELVKAVLQSVYEPHKSSPADVREEAIQCAAMAVRFCMSLAVYSYTPGVQHMQAKYCDYCGAGRNHPSPTCSPPFSVQPHAWTGKHPADAMLAEKERRDAQ